MKTFKVSDNHKLWAIRITYKESIENWGNILSKSLNISPQVFRIDGRSQLLQIIQDSLLTLLHHIVVLQFLYVSKRHNKQDIRTGS